MFCVQNDNRPVQKPRPQSNEGSVPRHLWPPPCNLTELEQQTSVQMCKSTKDSKAVITNRLEEVDTYATGFVVRFLYSN